MLGHCYDLAMPLREGAESQSDRVVRDKSDVIIGASVMVKNSTVGTVTDMDGRYSVEVPANGVLIFLISDILR